MNIVCLLGSARGNGNSSTLAEHFLDKAREYKADIKVFNLYQLNFKGCTACWRCQTDSEKCVLDDDLTQVFDAIRNTDLLLLASPIYFGDVSSSMKAFIERTYWYYNTVTRQCRLEAGKKLVFILSQGASKELCDSYCDDIFIRYNQYLGVYGFEPGHEVRLYSVNDPGDLETQEEVLRHTRALASQLCCPEGGHK